MKQMQSLALGLVAVALLAFGAHALQVAPYDSHTRQVLDNGANGLVFGPRATYRYAGINFTPVATPTDLIQVQGSATKTLRITRVSIGGVATAQGNMPVQLIKRSSAGTAGSAVLTAVTATKLDTTDPAATAVVSTVGTANFGTLGTVVGVVDVGRINMPAAGTGAAGNRLTFEYQGEDHAPIRLRGASEWLAINLNGAAVPSGGVIDWAIEIEEDNS